MTPEKERTAIERLKAFEPSDGYYLAYSGGKDSDCIKILAQLANVKFEAVHNLTTVDAPETVRYIKLQPDVRIDKAHYKDGKQKTMWNLIVKKSIPPTRIARYCCSELKERGGNGKVKIIGVRWAESVSRAKNGGLVKIIGKPKTTQKAADEIQADYQVTKQGGLIMNNDNDESRRLVEHCYRTTSTMISPIIDWTNEDVWEFLRHYGCKSNPLYECGYHRIGCIGCPMAGKDRIAEFERYPKYKALYINAFEKMQQKRIEQGKALFGNNKCVGMTGREIFKWWLGEDVSQLDPVILKEMQALKESEKL